MFSHSKSTEILEHAQRKLFVSGRPVDATVSLLEGEFEMVGELMVMSLLQGGPAPNFLDASVFSYLVNQPLSPDQLSTPLREMAVKVCGTSYINNWYLYCKCFVLSHQAQVNVTTHLITQNLGLKATCVVKRVKEIFLVE